jgi:glutamate 5-kinase
MVALAREQETDVSPEARPSASDLLARARRVVVKVGSSLLIARDGGAVNHAWLASLAGDVARLRESGRQVVLVSSGAVALGRRRLGMKRAGARLDEKQAAAAVGQSALMRAWEEALEPHHILAAQVLLTRDDTESRAGWLNARATVEALLRLGPVPIVNENDTVATDEIRYGDNDRLAARVAQLARADVLVLLSDVDGLYTADPRRDPGAAHVPYVGDLTADILAMGSGPNGEDGVGTGGMATKLDAARIARSAGCATLITLGSQESPLQALEAGARCTVVASGASPAAAYKQWIAGSLNPKGTLMVDDGAAQALASGRSLLASGIAGVDGRFVRGDCVSVADRRGRRLALGIVNYAADEVGLIRGRRSEELEAILGYKGRKAVIHRDDLAPAT